eukprot:2837761-Pyramimonas_sp.AAC.2
MPTGEFDSSVGLLRACSTERGKSEVTHDAPVGQHGPVVEHVDQRGDVVACVCRRADADGEHAARQGATEHELPGERLPPEGLPAAGHGL